MKRFFSPALFLLLVLTFSTPTYSTPQTTTLEPGTPVEQTIAAGEKYSYILTLAPGSYGLIDLEQKGINLSIVIFADGQQIRTADSVGAGLPEQLSLIAQGTTKYRVEIQPTEKAGRRGSYILTLKDIHPATDQDNSRVEAEKLSEIGLQLLTQDTPTARGDAINKFQQALALWQGAKDQANEAWALFILAYSLNVNGDYQKAFDTAQQGLPIARSAGVRATEAYLLDEIGRSYNNRGDRSKALEFFKQALPLRTEADPEGLANTVSNLGEAYAWIGDNAKALTYMEQAATLMRHVGNARKESSLLGNICVIQRDLGQYKKALEACEQALKTKREIGDRNGEAAALNNIANIVAGLGDYQKALDFYNQALPVHKLTGDRQGEGVVLNNIAWAYAQFGEYEKAIEIYNQALNVMREIGYTYGVAMILSNIGVNYAYLKDYRKALEMHLEALSLRPEKNDREGRGATFSNIAFCYSKLGDKQKALEHYTQALALHRSTGNQLQLAKTLKNFGVFQRDEGQTGKALDYLNEALTITRTIGDQSWEATTLSELAQLEFDRGNLVDARKLIEQAIVAIESVRTNLKSHQLRTSFLASVRKYYEFDLQVLMQMHQQRPSEGFAEAALQISEKGRARSLLELLREARAEIKQGVDPSLIERESYLRRKIAEKAEQQTRLLSKKYTEEQASALSQEIESLTTEYDQVQTRIRQASPRYAALVEPSPIGVEAIKKQLLDADTVLLEYALGEQKSFVWAVTPDSVKSFELPGRAQIEQEAKRFYQLLTQRGVNVSNETLAQRKERLNHAELEYPAVAANLSRMLLAPLAAELKQKRLVIVAEGVLQYVPFSALPSPGAERPLIVDHEIVTLPSASVLAELREEFANRKPASKAVAVLADPVFSATDARLTGKAADVSPVSFDAERSMAESGMGGLVRLRFSRQEADEIARLAGDKRNLKALDFSANRAVATDARLSDYRIVHFATHGLINNQHPDLSGIVLSLVDEQGRPQNGFLRLYDIYNLKLNADLVVLSACQTALGKEIKGEGLVGLTRGFMYAGAPRVVASFWRIDDRATADIMRRFYEAMLKDGLPPAAALRAAQVSMLNDKRWQSPHFWAAFTLQGEWQ
jgi:CHAT domain-containing protein/tetratricopeptide (TPR) repeat protein